MRIFGHAGFDFFRIHREGVVQADADMSWTDKVDEIVDMVGELLGIRTPVTEEEVKAHDADDAARAGAGLDLVVGDVAPVAAKRLGVGMGEDHRFIAVIHGLHAGAVASVGHVHEHAEAVHLVDDLAAEGRQASVGVVAAAAGEIVAIVGEQHLANAQTVIELHHLDPAVQCVHALQVEGYRELALGLGPADVGYR